MTTHNVQIEDNLESYVNEAIELIDELIRDYVIENQDTCTWDQLDYDGRIHEIIDGSVPIYTQDIKDCMYLHDDKLNEAFDNYGFDRDADWPMGWEAAAIYCYVEQESRKWWDEEAEDVMEGQLNEKQ